MTIKMIAAVSQNGVIGQDNKIPWNYPEDMKFFRTTTSNKEFPPTVIMGRKTFESMGSRKLPGRRNIVITTQDLSVPHNVETYAELWEAIELGVGNTTADVWLIGGERIYKEGMEYADEIYITEIPQTIEGGNLAYFPEIDENKFEALKEYTPLYNADGWQTLRVTKYVKRKS